MDVGLAVNKLLEDKDEITAAVGTVMSLTALVLTFALQVYVFKRLKKNAGTLIEASFL